LGGGGIWPRTSASGVEVPTAASMVFVHGIEDRGPRTEDR
jgi:hypothetical protein